MAYVADSGVYSGGSDSEEQLPLLDDDVTPTPQLIDNINDCEYVSTKDGTNIRFVFKISNI